LQRILALIIKEFIHVSRDIRMIGILIVVPIIQTVIFGLVVNTDIKNVNITIYDMAKSSESRELISNLTSSDYFSIVRMADNFDDIDNDILSEKSKAGLIINRGISSLALIVDGTDSNTASLIMKYSVNIFNKYNEVKIIQKSLIPPKKIDIRTRSLFNQNLDSRNFFLPGVVALIITIIITLLSSMAIVREKEIGTIDQIMVTPIKKYEFILGKLIPFAIIGYIDVTLAIIAAKLVFSIPLEGSLLLLYAGTTLYLIAMLGIGLIISTVSNTQQEAMLSTFFFIFPAILLSGFMFPIFNMPFIVKLTTYLNPLRFFLVISRSIFLKGSRFNVLYTEFIPLFILSFIIMTVAIMNFKKHL